MPFLVALFIGCQSKTEEVSNGSTDTGETTPDEVIEGTLSYHSDIEPLLGKHCTRCHFEGGLGSGDFTDPDNVEDLADWIRDAIEAERMPPPASDPECRDYAGSEHLRLPDASRTLFGQWIDEGMRRGEPGESAGGTSDATELADVDLNLQMLEAYTPTYAREDEPGNEYRCFVIDATELEGRYVTALSAKVGVPEIMHHITLSFVETSEVGAEYLDPQGWDCIDDVQTFSSEELFVGWAPGTLPWELPDGSGFYVEEGKSLVLQMHYVRNPDLESPSDQTGFDFRTADTVEQPLSMVPLTTGYLNIPAGSTGHVESESIPAHYLGDFEIYFTLPHLHQLGTGFDMRIIHSDGSETCVVNGDYSFDNQISYQFKEPIRVRSTDTIEVSCRFDNPTDQAVYYGERTDEEMCIFFTIGGETAGK